jgi:hypothetical protein
MQNRCAYAVGLLCGLVWLAWTAAASAATYYISPNGNDADDGSPSHPWQSLARAQDDVHAGDTVLIRGGRYAITSGVNRCPSPRGIVDAVRLDKSGTPGNPIAYEAYPGEVPVFDFSQMTDNCRVKGFNLSASWLTLRGLEITGVQQGNFLNHESWGVWIDGSHNILERLNVHHIQGAGVFLKDGGDNLILNTDSHHNYDPKTSNGAGQSADGFGAHIKAGHPGNIFYGCRAWANSDDGFDLINAGSPVRIEHSWAWLQGYLSGTRTPLPAGNGNGFKVGGYGNTFVAHAPQHIVRNSVAFLNKASGFYANHHPVANLYYNNTGFANGIDFNMRSIDTDGAPIYLGILRNNVAYRGKLTSDLTGVDTRYNSWDAAAALTDADFQSVSTDGWDAPRQPDGSLPDLDHLHPAKTGSLVDKGVDVGLPYAGAAPDLGAFENR